ncbi:protein FAM107B-like [Pristis pectinata]|uniref:protein FAM107B-like n=1 Tax=Pristis pectinata TaxID=685728 RepID=UPI00223CBCAF|nr:protein FAM107B-like [Pristis pectinata]
MIIPLFSTAALQSQEFTIPYDTADNIGIIAKLKDRDGEVPGHTVMGKQGFFTAGYAWSGNREAELGLKKTDITQPDGNTELIRPRKLNNPVKDSKSYRALHRELVLSHKRGFALPNKPELQRVMEQRKYNLLREQEKAQRPKTDFEQELNKRHQKLEQYEQEHQKLEEQENVPEFVKIKETLRTTKKADAANG